MAKLSERVTPNIEVTVGAPPDHQQMFKSYAEYMRDQQGSDCLKTPNIDTTLGAPFKNFSDIYLKTNEQENTMTQLNTTNSLRTLNLTLIDLSPELKGEDKVVYEQANVRTEYTDEQTIQNLLATGDVLSALQLHNKRVRSKTLDAQYKGSAREVFLDEIDHLGDSRLKWEVIRVG